MNVTPEQMQFLRKSLRSIYDVCEQCDMQGTRVEFHGAQLTVRQLFEIEVTAYLLYLSAADEIVSQKEIDFMSDLMGRDYSLENCSAFAAEHLMTGEQFSQTLPLSFKILSDFSEKHGRDITDVLISFYAALGAAISLIDDTLTLAEQDACTDYIYRLRGYKMLRDSGD